MPAAESGGRGSGEGAGGAAASPVEADGTVSSRLSAARALAFSITELSLTWPVLQV